MADRFAMPVNRSVKPAYSMTFVQKSESPNPRKSNMESLLERFCRYVRIDTQAVEGAATYPSSLGQLELGRLLLGELQALGLRDAEMDEYGIVMATVPSTVSRQVPAIAWLAHVDTSPETSGKNVKPIVHRAYNGKDITLPG